METAIPPARADLWLETIFAAKSVQHGGVVRRAVRWVEVEIGRDRFVAEVRRRGFHLVECGPQFIVICHQSGLRVLC